MVGFCNWHICPYKIPEDKNTVFIHQHLKTIPICQMRPLHTFDVTKKGKGYMWFN